MDLLFKRYANPFPFMDGMIQTGRFYEFVRQIIEKENSEREEQTAWEYFLHKVWEGSFADFLSGMENDKKNKQMSEKTMETTIKDSMNILKNFNPIKKGGDP
jgi:hypothetical protein